MVCVCVCVCVFAGVWVHVCVGGYSVLQPTVVSGTKGTHWIFVEKGKEEGWIILIYRWRNSTVLFLIRNLQGSRISWEGYWSHPGEDLSRSLQAQLFSKEESIVGLRVPYNPELRSCKVSVKGGHMKTGRGAAVITCGSCFHRLGFMLSLNGHSRISDMAAGARKGNGLMKMDLRVWVRRSETSWKRRTEFGERKIVLLCAITQKLDFGEILTSWNVLKLMN